MEAAEEPEAGPLAPLHETCASPPSPGPAGEAELSSPYARLQPRAQRTCSCRTCPRRHRPPRSWPRCPSWCTAGCKRVRG